jgi:ATP-binding cassette, subfamily B, bacterial PglK
MEKNISSYNIKKNSLINLLKEIYPHIKKSRKIQLIFLAILTFISSLAEVISLSAVVPFISALINPEKLFNSVYLKDYFELFGIRTAQELIVPIVIVFGVAAIFAGVCRIGLLYSSTRLSHAIGADFSKKAYRLTLYQPFEQHILKNSSEVISGITQKIDLLTGLIVSLVSAATSIPLFIAILSTILFFETYIASIMMISFGSFYLLIVVIVRNRLKHNSSVIADNQTRQVQFIQEGLGSIRDVILDGVHDYYCNNYNNSIEQFRKASGENIFITQFPRFALETVAMVLVSLLAFFIFKSNGGITDAIPTLAILALAAQRLLPLLQIIYGNVSLVFGSQAGLMDALDVMNQKIEGLSLKNQKKSISFKKEIRLENIKFKYTNTEKWVLNGLSLIIPHGSMVGFVGTTGSGKSTLLDLLMALIKANEGKIFIDNVELTMNNDKLWQEKVAHVPQFIYLQDTSIKENIAIGVHPSKIDFKKVKEAARKAGLEDFILSQSEEYGLIVGERGIRLSGGQRQRIGIARALYKNANLLVLDEATSSLDNKTELDVMNQISNLSEDLTIIIVAHRISSLKNCSKIIKIENGTIASIGKYQDFLN